MSKFWLNFKIALFLLVGVYVVTFLLVNRHTEIKIDLVLKTYDHLNMLVVLFMTCVLSIFGWWLFRTILKTLRQVRGLRSRAQMERATREAQEVVAKANKVH